MNMSYCRFRNTLADLQDCHYNLLDDDLSPAEEWAREQLIEVCRQIVETTAEVVPPDHNDSDLL